MRCRSGASSLGVAVPFGLGSFPAAGHYRLTGCRFKDALAVPLRGRARPVVDPFACSRGMAAERERPQERRGP
jgi:hypothetical protein